MPGFLLIISGILVDVDILLWMLLENIIYRVITLKRVIIIIRIPW
jgi:hypothetical protein